MTPDAQTNTKRSVKLEIRCMPEEKQRMQAIASARGPGYDISKVVRERFPEAFGTNTPLRARRSAPDGTAGSNGTVDLSEWLAERTGDLRALMRIAIIGGRVRVGGRVVTELRVAEGKVAGGVELDGEPVRST